MWLAVLVVALALATPAAVYENRELGAHDALCYGAKQRCRIPYATRRHGGVDVGNDNSLCASIESARGPELDRACGRRAVIRGEYGVGAACRNVLGARYKTVQRRVNQMLRWTICWHGIESPGVLSFVSHTVPFAESVRRHFHLCLSLSMCLLLWEGFKLWVSDSVQFSALLFSGFC